MSDDVLSEALSETVKALETAGIPYAVTDSVASSVYGEPHATVDLDIVCRMSPLQARLFDRTLSAHFYRNADLLVEIATASGVANLIDQRTGFKVDLSNLAASAFNEQVLTRRVLLPFGPGGEQYYFVSAEDIILMKLLWRRDTRSQKQWDNALSVVKVNGARLDWAYLRTWAERLRLTVDMELMMKEAGL